MGCKICGCKESKIIYKGVIRDGRFGNYTKEDVEIYQCRECGAMYHESIQGNEEEFYQSEKYRESMGEKTDDYEKLHDREVLEKLNYTGTEVFRNKVVADIGCAGGSFLDFVKGAASKCIGIEPTQEYHKRLREKGIFPYTYAEDAIRDCKGQVDIITSFDVIEHVENPLQFMKDCYELCSAGGKIVIGTPTEQPVMRMALDGEYDKFLFSTQHLWVLNKKSLEISARQAGFKNVEVKYKQRYGLGNLVSWLKYKKPMGNVEYPYVAASVEKSWIASCEERELADYIVVYGEK
ncbi:MAG: class I SAM-dependent methyltransferase [Lachnospiraceae bacterium]|nr:class I SAM-dependent methyltransferase [Lachnospiraceae bacterium]